jgi:hypothetical protein
MAKGTSHLVEPNNHGNRARQDISAMEGVSQPALRLAPGVEEEEVAAVNAATAAPNNRPSPIAASFYTLPEDDTSLAPGAVRIGHFGLEQRDFDEDDLLSHVPEEGIPISQENSTAYSTRSASTRDMPMALPVEELYDDKDTKGSEQQDFRDLIPSAEPAEQPSGNPALHGDDQKDAAAASFFQRKKWMIFGVSLVAVGIILVGVLVGGSSKKEGAALSFPPMEPTPTTLESRIRDIITTITLPSVLDNESTSQYKAYQWIKEDYESLQVLSGETIDTLKLNDTSVLQRYALSTLFYATNGSQWVNSYKFLSNVSECEWMKTRDEPGHQLDGEESGVTRCDDEQRIVSLQLGTKMWEVVVSFSMGVLFVHSTYQKPPSIWNRAFAADNNLSGSLPHEIIALSHIKLLSLPLNDNLIGPLPEQIGKMSLLDDLRLFDVALTGSLPDSFGSLNQLTYLAIQRSGLGGTLPASIGGLTALQTLLMEENNFSGALPTEVGKLKSLVRWYGSSNDFEGAVPSEVGGLQALRKYEMHF